MKATLEFNLPEEEKEFRWASDGQKAHLVIWEVEQLVWKNLDGDNLTRKERKRFEKLLEEINELKHTRNLTEIE